MNPDGLGFLDDGVFNWIVDYGGVLCEIGRDLPELLAEIEKRGKTPIDVAEIRRFRDFLGIAAKAEECGLWTALVTLDKTPADATERFERREITVALAWQRRDGIPQNPEREFEGYAKKLEKFFP